MLIFMFRQIILCGIVWICKTYFNRGFHISTLGAQLLRHIKITNLCLRWSFHIPWWMCSWCLPRISWSIPAQICHWVSLGPYLHKSASGYAVVATPLLELRNDPDCITLTFPTCTWPCRPFTPLLISNIIHYFHRLSAFSLKCLTMFSFIYCRIYFVLVMNILILYGYLNEQNTRREYHFDNKSQKEQGIRNFV